VNVSANSQRSRERNRAGILNLVDATGYIRIAAGSVILAATNGVQITLRGSTNCTKMLSENSQIELVRKVPEATRHKGRGGALPVPLQIDLTSSCSRQTI
jgi:hypothetical protein